MSNEDLNKYMSMDHDEIEQEIDAVMANNAAGEAMELIRTMYTEPDDAKRALARAELQERAPEFICDILGESLPSVDQSIKS